MDNKNSAFTSTCYVNTDVKQPLVASKSATAHQRDNLRRFQDVLLIWLDNTIDPNNDDYRNTITQLEQVVGNLNMYTDGDQCVQFIETVENNRVCMIVSDSFGQDVVSRVHGMSQVDTIFILCGNKTLREQWTDNWVKIKGIFTDIASLCKSLKQAAHQCEQNMVSISVIATDANDSSTTDLNRLDQSFMYTQILKEILLTINFDDNHIRNFIAYCRKVFGDSHPELNKLTRVQDEYRHHVPIWWYTCNVLLYQMVNRVLRTLDVDIIVRMGFFIKDLHRDIEQRHAEQYDSHHHLGVPFTVYRGQVLPKEEFEPIRSNKGGLLSFNNFLSTSEKREVSLCFADNSATNADEMGILFVVKIDPAQSTTPFARISEISHFHEEEELLFSMHTIFRIDDVKELVAHDGQLYLRVWVWVCGCG